MHPGRHLDVADASQVNLSMCTASKNFLWHSNQAKAKCIIYLEATNSSHGAVDYTAPRATTGVAPPGSLARTVVLFVVVGIEAALEGAKPKVDAKDDNGYGSV